MYPINNLHVQALVCYVSQQVVARFINTFRAYSEHKAVDYSADIEWFANYITGQIWRNWNDVTTAHQAENQLEDMYNAARTELVRLLNLQGGTVEFGPGDVQPLTDQRLGQAEAWDEWVAHMSEDNWGQEQGYYAAGQYIGKQHRRGTDIPPRSR